VAMTAMTQFSNTNLKWYVAVLALLVFAFLVRCYKINEPSVWMDEDHQAIRVIQSLKTGYFSGQSIIFSVKQQQPPLGYLMEGIGVTNFGVTPFGIRVHAAFLGALTVGVLLFLLTMLFPPQYKWYILLMVLIFSFHPLLLRYSQEARPIAVSIFFGSIYLYALLRFVFIVQHAVFSEGIIDFLLLVIAQTMFMLSVGFQPIALSFCLSLTLLLFVLCSKKFRKKSFLAGIGSMLSLGLFYPVQAFINNHAGHLLNEQVQSSNLSYFIDRFLTNQFPIIPFEKYKWFWEVLTGIPFWPTFVLFICIFLIIFFSKKMPNRDLLIFLGINCILFPIIFYSLFESFIDYRIMQRYILSALPVYVITIGSMYFSILVFYLGGSWWPQKIKADFHKYEKGRRILFALLFLLFMVPAFVFLDKAPSALGAPKREWNKLYSLFSDPKLSSKGDVAFAINLVPEGKWGPKFFSEKFYYLDNQLVKLIPTGSRNVEKIYDVLCKGDLDSARHIYLCFIYGHNYIRENLSLWKNRESMDIICLNGITVARLSVSDKQPSKALLEFFGPWVDNLPPQPTTDHIYSLANKIKQGS